MDRLNAWLARTGWRARGLDFLIGGLGVLGHAPFHIWPLTLLSFCYLFWRLDAAVSGTSKSGFARGFWFAFGYFLVGTYWISSAFIARGPEYIWLAPPMVIGLAAVLAFFWGLAGGLFVRFKPRGALRIGAFVTLIFLAEFARGHVLGGFPWSLPGYIFKGGGAASQFVSIGGIYGLSLIVIFVSGLLAGAKTAARPVIPILGSVIILAMLFGFGFFRLSHAKVDYVKGPLIRVVQVDFDQSEKMEAETSIKIVNQFLTGSIAPGIEKVTHIIWPEGAVSGLVLRNPELVNVMGETLAEYSEVPPIWIFNTLRLETGPDKNGTIVEKYYNSAAAIEFDEGNVPTLVSFNDKTRLVPFGEFIPLEDLLKSILPGPISTSLASISPAHEKVTSVIPGLPRVSPQICYEIIFSGLTPQNPRPEWILNQSNDAWYGNSIGPRQHANIAQFRAIEEGVPVIRSASNGVSGSIDAYGRWDVRVGMNETRTIDFELPKPIKKPFFFGNLNWYLLLINFIISVVCFVLYRGEDNRLR